MKQLAQSSATVALLLILAAVHGWAQEPSAADASDLQVQKLDVKAGMRAPKAIFQPEAEYSQEARDKNLDGRCLTRMIVDTKGRVQQVHVVRCSDMIFAKPTLAAVTRYRFEPALAADGKAVAVAISIETDFRRDGAREVADPIRLGIASSPGVTSTEPDSNGVYSLLKGMTLPVVTKFLDAGYGSMAFSTDGKSPCDVVLTIDAKGKPSDATASTCKPELGVVAIKSLLASKFHPSQLNGKAIAVRATIHLEYGDFPDTH